MPNGGSDRAKADAVIGLGCRPFRPRAVGRTTEKGGQLGRADAVLCRPCGAKVPDIGKQHCPYRLIVLLRFGRLSNRAGMLPPAPGRVGDGEQRAPIVSDPVHQSGPCQGRQR